jgi:hypothetical protein
MMIPSSDDRGQLAVGGGAEFSTVIETADNVDLRSTQPAV